MTLSPAARQEAQKAIHCTSRCYPAHRPPGNHSPACQQNRDDLLDALGPALEAVYQRGVSEGHEQALANLPHNIANLIGFTIDQGRLDGTDGTAVARAIRASSSPEEFEAALTQGSGAKTDPGHNWA